MAGKDETTLPINRPKGISDKQWSVAHKVYNAAKKLGDKFPELTLAQAVLESGWFKKESGKNNYFGQKASKNQKGTSVTTHEFDNNKKSTIQDKFRDYDSVEDSLKDRIGKWASKYKDADTVQDALYSIWGYDPEKGRGTGYATDPEYDKKIFGILGIKEEDTDTSELSSINEEVILTHPNLEDSQREELLKLNQDTGLSKNAISVLNNPSLFKDTSDLVDTEIAMRKRTPKPKPSGYTEDINTFPADFKLLPNPSQFEQGGLLNEFNVGGSHGENKHGGIPVSTNSEGGNNLVEEGETMYKKYIFSDSLKLDKKTADQFNIDEKFVGKTLADVSKRFNAEIEDRPFDKITVNTAKKELNKLILANESLKPSESSSTSVASDNQFFGGGDASGDGLFDKMMGKSKEASGEAGLGDYLGAANTAIQFSQQAFGPTGVDLTGNVRQEAPNVAMGAASSTMQGIQAGSAIGGPLGGAIGGALGLASGIIGGNKKKEEANIANHRYTLGQNSAQRQSDYQFGGLLKKFTNGGTVQDPDKPITTEEINASQNEIQFSDPNVVNRLFERTQKGTSSEYPELNLGKYSGVSDYYNVSVQGGKYNVNPGRKNYKNAAAYREDVGYLQKLNPNANIQGLYTSSGFIPQAGRRPENYTQPAGDFGTRLAVQDKEFVHGGDAKTDAERQAYMAAFPRMNGLSSAGLSALPTEDPGFELLNNSDFVLPNSFGNSTRTPVTGISSLQSAGMTPDKYTNTAGVEGITTNLPIGFNNEFTRDTGIDLETGPGVGGQIGNLMKKYGNDALRIAPILRNLLKKAPKAEVTSFPKLNARFKPSYMDEAALINTLSNQDANYRRQLMEASGGNQGAASANLLQLHSNSLRGVSDAMFQGQQFNAQQDQFGQQFNKDTDVRNQQIMTNEIIANEQNRAAAQAQKDAMRNAAWEDIGLLGREGKLGDILKKTTGYTPSGDKYDADAGFLSTLFKGIQKENSPQYTQALESYKQWYQDKYGK